ncbi:MAG: hypothetical protein FIB03_15280 [Anaerolineae bacterium]|nr:hypothetical protein [Anaerolineae bacterium]
MHSAILKKVIIILLAVVITGCSALPVDLSFLNTPTAGPTNSPEPTVTLITSREPTNTPDLFALNTEAPTNTFDPGAPVVTSTRQPTSTATVRPTITLEPVNPSLFTPSPNIFLSVQRSTDQLVWGSTCDGARSIQFIVQAMAVRRMRYVLLFYRLQDKYSGRNTDRGGGAIMKDNDQGTYFYTLELDQLDDYRTFEDAWLQYQFVASTAGLTVLGRSVVDRTSVSMTHCKVFNP